MTITIECIIDFGGTCHIQEVTYSRADIAISEHVEERKGLGHNVTSTSANSIIHIVLDCYDRKTVDAKLQKALNKANPLTLIAALAVAIPFFQFSSRIAK